MSKNNVTYVWGDILLDKDGNTITLDAPEKFTHIDEYAQKPLTKDELLKNGFTEDHGALIMDGDNFGFTFRDMGVKGVTLWSVSAHAGEFVFGGYVLSVSDVQHLFTAMFVDFSWV